MVLSLFAGCSVPAENDTEKIYSTSSAVSVYSEWLKNRLTADGRYTDDTGFIIGNAETAESYDVDVSGLSDEGFIIRRTSGEDTTLIFAKTNDGVDRGVRYYANYCSDEGELSVVKDEGYRIGKITIADADLSEYVIVNTDPDDEPM